MTIKITWLGHSAFALDVNGRTALLDPFLTNNPLAATSADDLAAEIIFVSHGHGDHVGDTISIAQRTGAKVVSNVEVCNWLSGKGVKHTHGQNSGGGYLHDWIHARLTVAFHSSSMPDGSYGGSPNGFVFTTSGKRLYFAGDTALFSDMQLIGDQVIDVAFLPIGDNYTMGPDDSLLAIRYLRPRFVIPMHYKTFPLIDQDVAAWANRVNSETNSTPIVLDPGATYTLV